MLRGHGSLKALLGRSVIRNNGKRQRKSEEQDETAKDDGQVHEVGASKSRKTQSTLFAWKQPPNRPAAENSANNKPDKESQSEASKSKKPVASNSTVWTFTARSKGRKAQKDALQLQSFIVARRFYAAQYLGEGATISFTRHTDDRGYESFAAFHKGEPLGQLPEEIWKSLQPLMDFVAVTATVSSKPKRVTSPFPITLSVKFTAGKSHFWQQALEDVCKAANSVRQHFSETTGECLRKNFLSMLDSTSQLDKHALSEYDLESADKLRQLSKPCQSLLLRLLLRKGPWFRVDSLWYEDVEDPGAAMKALHAAGFVKTLSADEPTDFQDKEAWKAASSVLQVNELWQALEHFNMQQSLGHRITRGRREDAICMLKDLATTDTSATLNEHLLRATGCVVSVEEDFVRCYKRVTRCCLLNEAQSVNQFLLADRGIARYPSYEVQRIRSAFSSLQQMEEFEAALKMASDVDAYVDEGSVELAAPIMEAAANKVLEGRHKWFIWTSGGALKCPLAASCRPKSSTSLSPPAEGAQDLCIDLSGEVESCSERGTEAADGDPQPLFLARFDAAWIYCELATMYVSYLEKKRRYKEACGLLRALLGGSACPLRRGHWWCRLAINLEHTGQDVRALEASESALADGWVRGGSQLDLQRRILRLGKPPRRWRKPVWAPEAVWEPQSVHIDAAPIVSGVGTGVGMRNRFMSHDGHSHVTVEDLALEHFALPENGSWSGVHCESGVWSTLFGILLWDVLFAPVPDVFRSPFQSAPLDLCTDAFAPARADVLQATLQRIRSGAALEMLEEVWKEHEGCWVQGVRWDRFGIDMLKDVVICVGGPGLACMCQCLAEDYASWMSGLPDLLLWNTKTKKARLVEVKGPTDSLSQQQRAWLRNMCKSGLDAFVAKCDHSFKKSAKSGHTMIGYHNVSRRNRAIEFDHACGEDLPFFHNEAISRCSSFPS